MGGVSQSPSEDSLNGILRREQMYERDLEAVEAGVLKHLEAERRLEKAVEDEVIDEMEDIEQGVQETIETTDFDMGKTLGPSTYFYMIFLKWLVVVTLACGLMNLGALRTYYGGGYGSRERRDRFSFVAWGPFCMDYEIVTATAGCPGGAASCDVSHSARCRLKFGIAFVDTATTVSLVALLLAYVVGTSRPGPHKEPWVLRWDFTSRETSLLSGHLFETLEIGRAVDTVETLRARGPAVQVAADAGVGRGLPDAPGLLAHGDGSGLGRGRLRRVAAVL